MAVISNTLIILCCSSVLASILVLIIVKAGSDADKRARMADADNGSNPSDIEENS